MRLTIEDYSKQFKMSKEMINSKLKAKKLNYIIEDSITYIIVSNEELSRTNSIPQKESTRTLPVKQKTTVSMILSLYQKENQQLKEKILKLEEKIDSLIDDKEQMLRDEMGKIEQVYNTKDEQLKNIIELINTKLIAENNNTIHEVETLENSRTKNEAQIVELKSYLKTLDIEPHFRKIIKKRFLSVYGKDIRIIKQNGKLYLDFSKYDYSDLLES